MKFGNGDAPGDYGFTVHKSNIACRCSSDIIVQVIFVIGSLHLLWLFFIGVFLGHINPHHNRVQLRIEDQRSMCHMQQPLMVA